MLLKAQLELPRFEGDSNLSELEWSPGSATAGDQKLCVTHLAKGGGESARLRKRHAQLLADAPDTAVRKFGQQHLDSAEGRAKLLVGLVSKHTGELVELDFRRSSWDLRAVVPGSASAAPPQRSEQ